MKKFKNWFLGKIQTHKCMGKNKKKGMVILIPTIILSGLIMAVGIGLSQVMITELEFSADLLFSEKAYFAAESGVEKSLLALKDKPINWVDTALWDDEDRENLKVGTGATYDLLIDNSVYSFEFDLSPQETLKFRLGVDNEYLFSDYSPDKVHTFKIDQDSPDLQWKIICQNFSGQTVSLQERGDSFGVGKYDDGQNETETKNVSNFLGEAVGDPCFMSLTNLIEDSEMNIEGTVKADSTNEDARIAPAKVTIRAVGRSFFREKVVTFQYLQKNISSLFNLGLYFKEAE